MHGPAVELGSGLAAQEDLVAGVDQPAGIAVDVGLAEPVTGAEQPVLPVRASLGYHRLQIDLDLHLGQRQALDDQSRADGVVAAQVLGHRPVDRYPVGWIGEVGGNHGDVVEARPGLLQQHPGVLHRLVCLGRRVGRVAHPLREVESGLAAQEDAVPRPDGHAHVVVVAAAGVDVAGVELAEPLDFHRCAPSCRRTRIDTREPSLFNCKRLEESTRSRKAEVARHRGIAGRPAGAHDEHDAVS